jgi:hypothetical protein
VQPKVLVLRVVKKGKTKGEKNISQGNIQRKNSDLATMRAQGVIGRSSVAASSPYVSFTPP